VSDLRSLSHRLKAVVFSGNSRRKLKKNAQQPLEKTARNVDLNVPPAGALLSIIIRGSIRQYQSVVIRLPIIYLILHNNMIVNINRIIPLLACTSYLSIDSAYIEPEDATTTTLVTGLRSSRESKAAAIGISDQSSDDKYKRELLSPWCDPATPVLWHA